MKQHALRLQDNLMEAVDSARGDVPRNVWIVRLLEREVWGREGSVLGEAGGPLKASPPKVERSPVLEAGAHLAQAVQGMGAEVDGEFERRRRIAATHKPGCKCLNCIA